MLWMRYWGIEFGVFGAVHTREHEPASSKTSEESKNTAPAVRADSVDAGIGMRASVAGPRHLRVAVLTTSVCWRVNGVEAGNSYGNQD